MALTFGKGNRSIAFNPTSAFPLDARSYFESYELAAAAAQTAGEAGSTDTQYYFGQQIVVVENNVANFYIIQPDKTLTEVGSKVEINENVFEYIDGKLNLYGFSDAVAGAQLTKDSEGKLLWIKPDTTTVEGLSTAIANLQKDLDDNYYTKLETEEKIAAAPHLKRVKVDSVADINPEDADADQYIYMVPSGLEGDDNKYYEYIIFETKVTDGDGVETVIKTVEQVGSWEVNLEDYAKLTDLDNKVDKDGNKVLIDPELLSRLEALLENPGEDNLIKSVNISEFTISEEGQLDINKIEQSKVDGLVDNLNNKVDKIDGKDLSTNDFTDDLKNKLDSINLNDIANTKTSVDQLSNDIYGYTNNEGEEIPGLSDSIVSIQKEVGTLATRANGVDGKITSLETGLTAIPKTYVSIDNFNKVVGNMEALLTQQINIIDEINDINQRLTWSEIPSENV